MRNQLRISLLVTVLAAVATAAAMGAEWRLDETPAQTGEWGFRPADGSDSAVTPPGFVWRPQPQARGYELQVSPEAEFRTLAYEAKDLDLYCHCPPRVLAPGKWYWRFRAKDRDGAFSAWSTARSFTIPAGAVRLPLPGRQELMARVPKDHPRLFLRPEDLPRLRERCKTDLAEPYQALVRQCEQLLKKPPPTAEPKKYEPDMVRGSDPWRERWWGNRVYTMEVLDSAATLAFVRRLNDNEACGQLARRLLMEAARWDPKGATGFRYNDEAGMPYASRFSRTYTLLYDLLTEEERETCRRIMGIRGREMYDHLRPMHIWKPYNSHNNRAWHFLGEVGVAFLGEIPEAEDWVWFAMNVYQNAYPVWCDDDGGWHEGLSYWRSYIERFTWWADIMRSAFAIDAYRKPYFSQIGYYPLYLQPPGTMAGGFGDLCGKLQSSGNVPLMQVFAASAGNPYWQWYVDQHKPLRPTGYVEFLRGALPRVAPRPPSDLPTSRLFRGTGQAFLNTTLLDAGQNVQVLFKSSPFGTQSHGYDANNAFLLYLFGRPVFISSGTRDSYGSEHHSRWMWHTKSTNCITVDGEGQVPHSAQSRGAITRFETDPGFDYVAGEAGSAYGGKLKRFTRRFLFVKPELIVIHDLLEAPQPSRFDWWLHSPEAMSIEEGGRVLAGNGQGRCEVAFLEPRGLTITQTDRFDPPPRPRIRLTEYHLTASTPSPDTRGEFVTVLRPYRGDARPTGTLRLIAIEGGWAMEAELSSGKAVVLLRNRPGARLEHGPVSTEGQAAAVRLDPAGRVVDSLWNNRPPRREGP
ncbi:MAG: DUF4962 domain-containing protein [Phycisphaerae bacterium]|jgi:hypothetical protein